MIDGLVKKTIYTSVPTRLLHSLYDVYIMTFSSTLQFIIVLVATAVLDIIQLGLYFVGNPDFRFSK